MRQQMQMSSFELRQNGDKGFALEGAMSFETADQILTASEKLFGSFDSLEIDLSRVNDADSAGLALLLEWKARAQRAAGDIRFVGLPESLIAIAQTAEVSDLIR